jgi:hypothetical protein
MNFYPGQSVMCSYVTFGIDGKQLEWKQSKNDDVEYQAAKWNLIAKGVNAGVNAIATSVNIYQDNKKGKELAKVQGTFVYEFNGKTLTKKYECATVDYTGGNSKVGCVDGGTLKPDDAGQKYCLIPVENPVDYCSTILPAQSCDSLDNKCEFDKEGKLNCTCFVKIEDVSGAKVEEKANSLIKQAGLLDAAKMQIGMGQMNLQMNSMMYQAGNTALMNQAMNSFGTNNTNTTKQKCNRTSAITFTNDVVNSGQPEVYYDSCQPAGCNYNGTQSICTKYCIPTTQNCQKGTDGEWYVGSGTETNVTGFNVKQFSTNIKGVSDSATDIYSAVNTANMGAMKSIQSAAAVGSSYTDNQAAVNKQEQQVAAVEQSKNQNMNNVVQLIAGKEGLFGIITDKVAMDMAYDSKGQQMTGFCYIGDPNKGSGVPFARENESKRLGWMN